MTEIEDELYKGIVRNLSRLIILWLLTQKPYSGYEVLKEMKKIAGQDFHPGVIYPLLYELEEGKYIAGAKIQKGRRQMTYYSITDRGKELFERMRSLFQLPIGSVLQELLSEKSDNSD